VARAVLAGVTAMRVLLLADTHGVLDARIAELAQDCALAVHAGDVGASDVLKTLAAACGRVFAVRGNNDVPGKWRGSLDDLAALPKVLVIPLPGGRLVVVHDHQATTGRRPRNATRGCGRRMPKCNDPVIFCSGITSREIPDEHHDGRRHQALDGAAQVSPGSGNHPGQDDGGRGEPAV